MKYLRSERRPFFGVKRVNFGKGISCPKLRRFADPCGFLNLRNSMVPQTAKIAQAAIISLQESLLSRQVDMRMSLRSLLLFVVTCSWWIIVSLRCILTLLYQQTCSRLFQQLGMTKLTATWNNLVGKVENLFTGRWTVQHYDNIMTAYCMIVVNLVVKIVVILVVNLDTNL